MLFVFFVLCSALTPALCCDWLDQRFSNVNNECLTHLKLMGDPLTEEESPVPFPYDLYQSMRNTQVLESQLLFIRDSLKLISDLYHHGNRSSAAWNTNEETNFLITIDRQNEELNKCVSIEKPVKVLLRKYYKRLEKSALHRMLPVEKPVNVTLSEYYKSLEKSALDRTGGGTTYWELIRMETKRHLDQLEMLVSIITSRRRSAASPH
ncbi:interferon a3-like [Thunnus maccoyii]|uniref:interferon a3-like n=1 Tax=Thunnus maccoyii TaxID=8240 RepID=UPI001C4B0146|nr:interferon a3-like [Thunnus maccoyii]